MIFATGNRNDYDIVHDFWNSKTPATILKTNGDRRLHDGLIASTKMPGKKFSPRAVQLPSSKQLSDNLEITFCPDSTIYDGRFANNGWLSGTSKKPVTKLVWDNAALISPALAKSGKPGKRRTGRLSSQFHNRKLKNPGLDHVWPGGKFHLTAIWLWTKTNIGNVGRNVGVNAYELRTSNGIMVRHWRDFEKTGEKNP